MDEAELAGWQGLHIDCNACRRITQVTWPMIRRRSGHRVVTRDQGAAGLPEVRAQTAEGRVSFASSTTAAVRPYSDYSGQKYLLALKLSGFDALEDTPLRFVELQAGYFARGFTDKEREDGDDLRREPYIGIGVNLSELLFGQGPLRDTLVGRAGRRTLEYIQVPYTYAAYPYN